MDGKKHGQGSMFFIDGSVYSGDFFEDQITGFGTLRDQNEIYVGEFLDAKKHGHGRFISQQIRHEGKFEDGSLVEGRILSENLAPARFFEN